MPRDRSAPSTSPDAVISIIGPGMSVEGDCRSDGTIRVEGRVHGTVSAEKAVVVGKDGVVDGHVLTQDAVISGRVTGTVTAESRLEVQATAHIEGEVRARRMQLEEGAQLNGRITMGEQAIADASVGAGTHGADAGAEDGAADEGEVRKQRSSRRIG